MSELIQYEHRAIGTALLITGTKFRAGRKLVAQVAISVEELAASNLGRETLILKAEREIEKQIGAMQ